MQYSKKLPIWKITVGMKRVGIAQILCGGMKMENIQELITLASAVLGIIVTATGLLIPLVKNAKARKSLAALNKLGEVLQKFVIEAETFTNFTGAEKKEYVMTKANRYAIDNKISYDENAVSEKVEDLVALSKQVNNKRSDLSENKTTIRI